MFGQVPQQQQAGSKSSFPQPATHSRTQYRSGPRSASLTHRSCLRAPWVRAAITKKNARTDELPAVLLDVVKVDGVTGVRITVPGGVDTPAAKL